ncbi:MAG: hypothetical protein KatS3mg032_2094 [Cyclobacteriaceae bacterium]|nr:MAG: hypothetical protein KatS3mg032_2094 [Cyclobacteriaceae bacterium]
MLVAYLIMLTSCTSRQLTDRVTKNFLSFLYAQGYSPEVDGRQVYFVITLEGCNGCIDACLDFVTNQYRDEKLKIVLTQSTGPKSMKLRVGEQLVTDPKVIKDYDNTLQKYEVVNFEPVVFFFEDSKPIKYIYLNTSNLKNTLEEIRLYLTSPI